MHTFCQNTIYSITKTFSSSEPFTHADAFNPFADHRVKFHQLKKLLPTTKMSADAQGYYTGLGQDARDI